MSEKSLREQFNEFYDNYNYSMENTVHPFDAFEAGYLEAQKRNGRKTRRCD